LVSLCDVGAVPSGRGRSYVLHNGGAVVGVVAVGRVAPDVPGVDLAKCRAYDLHGAEIDKAGAGRARIVVYVTTGFVDTLFAPPILSYPTGLEQEDEKDRSPC
jgi:hypothetical protein